MLIIQHIWTKWTKWSRGANARLQRPRLDEAYALPELPVDADPGAVLLHQVRALEGDGFALVEEFGPIDREAWPRLQPHRNTALDWVYRGDSADIILIKPSEHRQQTKWPAH